MGTRALVHVRKNGETLLTIYRQFDGYPEGLGQDLKKIMTGKKVVDGFTSEDIKMGNFNGIECLAATIVKNLKEGIGNTYIYPIDSYDVGEEYCYHAWEADGVPMLRCLDAYSYGGEDGILYEGTAEDFDWKKAQKKQNDFVGKR